LIAIDYIEQNILTEEEKGFNQTVLYGRDVTVEDIVSAAKRYHDGGTTSHNCKKSTRLD
jgi:hypothetical protein